VLFAKLSFDAFRAYRPAVQSVGAVRARVTGYHDGWML
jgi:hypothetical protein